MPLGNPIRKQNESRMVSVLATDGQTVFTVQGGYIINHISVFRNGVRLSSADDFTAGDGSTVTLNEGTNVNDRIDFHIFDRFTVQNAIVGAASSQTISGDLVVNGKVFGALDASSINLTGIITATNLNITGVSTFQNNVHLLDGDRLQIGGSAGTVDGIELYHDGSDTYISHTGTGNLYIDGDTDDLVLQAGDDVRIQTQGNENAIVAKGDGPVEIYHDAAKKVETTSSGLNVTGILTATTFSGAISGTTGTFSGDVDFGDATSDTITFTSRVDSDLSPSGSTRDLGTSGVEWRNLYTSGGVVASDTISSHSGDADTKIRFPAADTVTLETAGTERVRINSTGNVGLGVADPNILNEPAKFQELTLGGKTEGAAIHLKDDNGNVQAGMFTSDSTLALILRTITNHPIIIRTNNDEKVRITNTGLIGIGTDNPVSGAAGARVNIYFKDETTYDSTTNRANGLIINNTASGGYSSLELAQRTTSGNTYGSAIINAVDPADGNTYGADLTFQTRASGSGSYGERMRITAAGQIGINTTAAYSLLTAYGENKSDSGSATGQITAKDNAAYNATPTGGIIFMGNYHSNGAQAVFAGITGLKEDSTDGTYNGALAFHSRAHGAVAVERMRIDSGGRVLIGTTSPLSFNGVGQYHNLIVAGTWSDTDITDNSHAAITISNKDGTANNTSGLHFAREDTDGNPHYNGASIVAQFQDTMATGQYPKADLAFLTSTAANNAPSQKMRLKADGEVLSTASFVSKTTAEYNANVSTASGFTADAFNVVLAQDVLDNHSVYIVNFSWNHQGSGQPYLVDGAFVFQPGATNPGSTGAMGPNFVPAQGAHTENGVSKYFTFRYYSPTGSHTHGLQAAFSASLNDSNGNGYLQMKIFKIGAETTI